MNERKPVEAAAAEIDLAVPAPAAGDHDRGKGAEQLAHAARRISTEALSAELAAQRGDWETVHATYEQLALLFAEYRLLYVRYLAT